MDILSNADVGVLDDREVSREVSGELIINDQSNKTRGVISATLPVDLSEEASRALEKLKEMAKGTLPKKGEPESYFHRALQNEIFERGGTQVRRDEDPMSDIDVSRYRRKNNIPIYL